MSEFAMIEHIRARAAASHVRPADLALGIGDDTAILTEQAGRELLITTDLLVEEIDFKLEYAVPRWLGHKSLAVSLSDIAAMGGTPRFALLTLGIPRAMTDAPDAAQFWEKFFDGFFALAATHNVALIGGDISSVPQHLSIEVTALGHCPKGQAIRRDSARVGDAIFVTGSLGASAAGLQLLLSGAQADPKSHALNQNPQHWPATNSGNQSTPTRKHVAGAEANSYDLAQAAIQSHLQPQPRTAFGQQLGASQLAHSLIDVSDGLAQDLAHLCEASAVSAMLDFTSVPVADCVQLLETEPAKAFQLAITGGEDYELLFTAAPQTESALQAIAKQCDLPLTRIGQIIAPTAGQRLWLQNGERIEPLTARGFQHF